MTHKTADNAVVIRRALAPRLQEFQVSALPGWFFLATMKYLRALPLLSAVAAPVSAAFSSWANVNINGGGGFVDGIVFHPKTKGLVYARTDVGGLYRGNSADTWTPITDGIITDAGW